MTAGILNSALSGLFASQVQLETASHNLANATVEGYHRQRVILSTRDPLERIEFAVGRGVDVLTVERVLDRFVERQLREARSDEGLLDTLQQQVNQIADVLQDGGEALTTSMQAFFGAFSGLTSTPTSQPQRQLVLSTGAALSGAFATLQGRLDVIRDSLDTGISSAVTQLDDAATNLARTNVLIVEQGLTSLSGASPDLLDSRDRLVDRIASLVNTSVLIRQDGTVTVQIAGGRTLVEGGNAARVTSAPSETAPSELGVYFTAGSVTTKIDDTSITKGTLGGLLEMRRETLDYTEAQLGRFALSLVAELNEQHKAGFDNDSQAGEDIFLLDEDQDNQTILDPTKLYSTATTYSDSIGRRVQASLRNDGEAQMRYTIPVDATDPLTTRLENVRKLTGDSYSIVYRDDGDGLYGAADFTITALFGGRQVTLDAADYTQTGNSARIEFEGIRLLIDDVTKLEAADAFEVRPTAGLAGLMKLALNDPGDVAAAGSLEAGEARPGDGVNAQALANLQRASVVGAATIGTGATFTEAFSEIVGTVGVQAESAKLRGNAQTALVRQLVDQQQSLSGVNLDEEAANLLRYQQAYQASAKLIAIAGSLLQSLLEI